MNTKEILEELLHSDTYATADSELLEWADKIDLATSVDERIAIIESMPPDLTARYVEKVHPS